MNKLDKESIIGISALLVHAANIDEIYSDHEKDLVKSFIRSYLENENTNEILKKAEDKYNISQQSVTGNVSDKYSNKKFSENIFARSS